MYQQSANCRQVYVSSRQIILRYVSAVGKLSSDICKKSANCRQVYVQSENYSEVFISSRQIVVIYIRIYIYIYIYILVYMSSRQIVVICTCTWAVGKLSSGICEQLANYSEICFSSRKIVVIYIYIYIFICLFIYLRAFAAVFSLHVNISTGSVQEQI
jgi:hypothetical protein